MRPSPIVHESPAPVGRRSGIATEKSVAETSAHTPSLAGEGGAKEQMTAIIQDQPDDSSYEEILRELAFHRMILRGLSDARDGNPISATELRRRLRSWHG